MADKRLRLIVEAVTSAAQKDLRSLSNEIARLGDQGAKGAGDLADLQKRAEGLLSGTRQLGQEARDLRRDMEASAQGTEAWSMATSAAADAAVMLAAGFAALKLGEKVMDLARSAAAAQGVEEAFERLAGGGYRSSQLLLESLDRAAKGTITDYDLMKEANEAWYLGITKNTDQYIDLMKIAEERSKDLGITTLEYWQRFTSGLSSGYSISLRQLGIVIDMDRAYESYGLKIGKVADDLDEQERMQARVEAAIVSGASSIKDWESAEENATTATQQFDAATANLRDTIKEGLLPVLLPAIEWITRGLEGIDQGIQGQNEVFGEYVKTTGSVAAATEAFAKNIEIGSQGLIDHEQALIQAGKAATYYTNSLIGAPWGQMHQDSARARMAILDAGDAADSTSTDMDELAKAVKKAQDIWGDYGRSVAQENWQMARRVADAQFSMTQAAENAAFDLYKIERNSADRRSDLLASSAISQEADTARHYNNLRYMKQDLNDSLADMEWDYQRERQEAMDKAPWWIRQALGAEFAERDRIAKTGDAEALAAYDKYLSDKIKAIDPAYAIELEKLREQHKHEQDIEKRDSGQALKRAKDDWEIQQREQDRALGQQLYELERNLGCQLDEWHFHQAQREESERHSMDNLIIDHEHSLTKLYEDTMRKLSEIETVWQDAGYDFGMAVITGLQSARLPDLFKHEGYAAWLAYLKGTSDAQSDYGFSPSTGYDPSTFVNPFATAQHGIDYVPKTMPVLVHKGESILPAPAAQQWREGSNITINLSLGGGYTPYQGQQMAAIISDELGRAMRRNAR